MSISADSARRSAFRSTNTLSEMPNARGARSAASGPLRVTTALVTIVVACKIVSSVSAGGMPGNGKGRRTLRRPFPPFRVVWRIYPKTRPESSRKCPFRINYLLSHGFHNIFSPFRFHPETAARTPDSVPCSCPCARGTGCSAIPTSRLCEIWAQTCPKSRRNFSFRPFLVVSGFPSAPFVVMPGLVPGIHVRPPARPLPACTAMPQDVDARNKSGHDAVGGCRPDGRKLRDRNAMPPSSRPRAGRARSSTGRGRGWARHRVRRFRPARRRRPHSPRRSRSAAR